MAVVPLAGASSPCGYTFFMDFSVYIQDAYLIKLMLVCLRRHHSYGYVYSFVIERATFDKRVLASQRVRMTLSM